MVLVVVGDFPIFIQNRWRWGGQCVNLKGGLPYGLSGDPRLARREDLLSGLVLPPGGPSPAWFSDPPAKRTFPQPSCSPSRLLCWAPSQAGGALDAVSAN